MADEANVHIPAQPMVPIHDAILPYTYDGVLWAIPNVGDNVETENSSMAELFESINRTLLTLSNMRDGFVINPPSIEAVKAHHNAYVRIDRYVKSRTKADNQARFDIVHVTPKRRRFTRYPVRYFDLKNRWIRRWVELYLYGLSNMSQLSEANTYVADWTPGSAKLIMKPFREAYRISAIDLFGKPLEAYSTDEDFPLLSEQDFIDYSPSELIPTYELLEHPFTAFFTEDRLRNVSTPSVKPGEGVTATGGDQLSPGEVSEQAVRDAQRDNPIIP